MSETILYTGMPTLVYILHWGSFNTLKFNLMENECHELDQKMIMKTQFIETSSFLQYQQASYWLWRKSKTV